MRCSCRLETMRSWLWHPNQSHLVTLQLCIARQTWIQNSNDQDSERDLKIDEQISRLYDWRPVLYIGMLKHSNLVACYIEPRVSLYCAGFLTATRIGWQHSHLIDLSSSARHLSHSPRLRGISQSVSRVSDQSGSSQLTAGLAGPTPTLWRHSVTASVTHLPLGSASLLLSHVTGGVMQKGFSRVILRLWSQLRWGGSAANESRLWRQTRGWLSWGGQQASASNPHET